MSEAKRSRGGAAKIQGASWVHVLQGILEHPATRVVLSIAIVVSLIPHPWMHANDMLFVLLFGPEFIARLLVACRTETEEGEVDVVRGAGWKLPSWGDSLLLLVDLIALLSFFPWADHSTRWLRLFRLSRSVMLLRYWAPTVRDLWAVIRQRERARQVALMMMIVMAVAFAGAVVLNHATDEVGEDFDGDGRVGDAHDHKFWVRMYWALRQIEDPGNMLSSPHEVTTLVVSIGLTFFGLFLISFVIGVGTDAVQEIMVMSNLRSPGLRRHNVLINVDHSTKQLLVEVMEEYKQLVPEGLTPLTPRWFRELRKRGRQQREFVVVGKGEEPPDFLRTPELGRIIYRENSDEDDEAFLDRADVPLARRVVVLADVDSDKPDDETVRTLITIVERVREVDENDNAFTELIAEVLDESNIGAARKAIARASGRVEAHLVPTERLLALFAYSVGRRRGVGSLLMELITSSGHELYSYDYRRDDDSSAVPLGGAAESLEALFWRGLNREAHRRVLPLGVLWGGEQPEGEDVVLRPDINPPGHVGRFGGFVAIAPNLRVTADFADEVKAQPSAAAPPIEPAQATMPQLQVAPSNEMGRVLICGFRPATVNLVEAIIATTPTTEILILVEDEDAKSEALDDFEGYSNLVNTGLLDGPRGTFHLEDDALRCRSAGSGGDLAGHIHVEVGDWTSTRMLTHLPRGFGAAPEVDAVIMISSARSGSDATTATALMKLEHLRDHVSGGTSSASDHPIVVAELVNADLAHRLDRRYREMGHHNVMVFSIHELRAFFMFQSVVVPNFHRIYGELLAPWGQSLVRIDAAGGQGRCSFIALAAWLRTQGHLAVAIEIEDAPGHFTTYIAQGDPNQDDHIELSQLRGVWVVRTEDSAIVEPPDPETLVVPEPPAAPEPPPQPRHPSLPPMPEIAKDRGAPPPPPGTLEG